MKKIKKIKIHYYVSLILIICLSRYAFAETKVEKNVIYGMFSGLGMTMDVYYPENPNGYGIIFISGSAWTSELSLDAKPLTESGQELIYAVPLADAGYTVFNINHRTAPRFRYPAPVEDVQRAVRYIRHHAEKFDIDPSAIGGMGGSSGAHLISLLGTMNGDGNSNDSNPVNRESAKLQVVVTRASPTDLRTVPSAPLFGYRTNAAKHGSIESKLLDEASPIKYVTSDDAAFLLIHGDADTVVPYEWSVAMYNKLKAVGVESNLITIVGGGHGPRYESTALVNGKIKQILPDNPPDYIAAMIRWFDTHLANSK